MKALLRAACVMMALCASLAGHASIITYTDSSWRVTATAPGGNWASDIGFDDSTWQNATWLYDVAGSPADGIWAGNQFGTDNTDMWARHLFNLDALPLLAWIYGGLDDDGEIYVNGILVHVENNGIANNFMVDITAYLVSGINLIAYHAYDNYPVWGYNHSGWLEVHGEFAHVPVPPALWLFGAGVLMLVGQRRLRATRQ